MQIEEQIWNKNNWTVKNGSQLDPSKVQLVFLFGDIDEIANISHIEHFQLRYPNAKIVGSSTAGTIESGFLSEHSLVATIIAFDHAWVEVACIDDLDNATLEDRSKELFDQLSKDHLKHVFVLMEGLALNGSLLVKGINDLAMKIPMTGALAGDGYIFNHTLVIANGTAKQNRAVAIGFYGDSLSIKVGCGVGWQEFGAQRVVTRSDGNVIYEIDHKPALKFYEDYLGEHIKDLPASALPFPLNIHAYDGDKDVVRVMMGINEDQSIYFAGDIPQGSTVRLMKTSVLDLIEGAEVVGKNISLHSDKPSLAIAVSCGGRRNVLKEFVSEEIQAMQEQLGGNTHVFGLYSYGELAPFPDNLFDCKLHNQTMTVTAIYENVF
ncbi:MAG: FIST N-terminal domain-containing protein [Sulfuricurvum sp.]|nr:FIST N-terminal domain-containing protein [Sulfuricurvum sp.]